METTTAKGVLPVHMTPKAEYLREPHAPPAEPDKVTTKKASAKLGGGWVVTVHGGGTFREYDIRPREANSAEQAERKAREKYARSQSPEVRHRAAVAKAVQDRKHVPAEVLADYPDLEKGYKAVPNYARPDAETNRVPGSDLRLRVKAAPKAVEPKGKGKAVLDIGPDPRNGYGEGDVVDVKGVPHVITNSSAPGRRKSEVAPGESGWSSNIQDVQLRPLTDAERGVYEHVKAEFDRRQAAEASRPAFQD